MQESTIADPPHPAGRNLIAETSMWLQNPARPPGRSLDDSAVSIFGRVFLTHMAASAEGGR